MNLNLDGTVAVILGGTGHLGSAFTLGLLNAGAKVLAVSRNQTRLGLLKETVGSLSTNLEIASCDVHDYSHVEETVSSFEKKVGPISALINNAYQASGNPKFLESSSSDISFSMQYLTSTIINTQYIANRMVANGIAGSIVNVSSMYGMVSPKPFIYDEMTQFGNPPVYGAIKAGILQFTRYAAVHLAPSNIRVNSISPGAFPLETPDKKNFISRLQKQIPLQRIGEPKELISGLIYLLGENSSYVTGTNLVIDGGWTAW